MRALVLCKPRPGAPLSFVLAEGESVLGREAGLTVALPYPGVARRHASISWDGRFHWLEDLQSGELTRLNGRAVRRERLRHLDVITLGRTLELVFSLRDEEYRPQRVQGIVRAALQALQEESETYEIPTGEILLGRSPACNLLAESGAVSKVHARIERRLGQLALEDLGSSNGTFVNGVRVVGSLLHDGDLLLLGGVVGYRVLVELGEVTSSSGARARADVLSSAGLRARGQFGSEWRARFEWGSRPAPASESERPTAASGRVRLPAPVPQAAAAELPPAPPSSAAPAAAPVAPVPPTAVPAPSVAEPVPAAGAILEVRLAGSAGELVAASTGAHQIGRASDCALRVDHPTVSRRHARIILAEDRALAYLQDLGGANGTWLDGLPVTQPVPLKDGHTLKVGEVELRVRLRRA